MDGVLKLGIGTGDASLAVEGAEDCENFRDLAICKSAICKLGGYLEQNLLSMSR